MQRAHQGSVRIALGFLREAPDLWTWLLAVIRDMGMWLLVVPLAIVAASSQTRRLALPLLCLWPLANVVAFTPKVYDNIKLLAWFDLAAAVLVADWLAGLLRPAASPAKTRARAAFAVLSLVSCTLSGALAVVFELTNDARVISNADLELARLVATRTPKTAVVATAATTHDPVAMFSGRATPISAAYILVTQGIDVRPRARDVVELYAGGEPAREVIARLGVTAVVVGRHERAQLPTVNEAFIASISRERYETGADRLYILAR
jgi:hypothetical protein